MDVRNEGTEGFTEALDLRMDPYRVHDNQLRRALLLAQFGRNAFGDPPAARQPVQKVTVLLQSAPFSGQLVAILASQAAHNLMRLHVLAAESFD